jgi:uncharacterized protein YaaN involved in tellurite resistance
MGTQSTKIESPFSKTTPYNVGLQPPVTPNTQLTISPLSRPPMDSQAIPHIPAQANPVIKMSDIEELGTDVSKRVSATTDKIIAKMNIGNFDELGEILTAVQVEADKLNPGKYERNGWMGWIKNRFSDVKKELTLNFSSAEQVFDQLNEQINNHIMVHQTWIKDLELLYSENYARYQELVQTIFVATKWEEYLLNQLATWPEIDTNAVDAPMKVQERRDAENVLSRLRIKMDSFLRRKVIMENHSIRIRDQQETSRTTISNLGEIVGSAIPMIRSEFGLFLHSLDAKKSNTLTTNVQGLVNTTFQKSADTAKEASIQSAIVANTSTVSTETIKHIRDRMLETLVEVQKVQQDAQARRIADAEYIKTSQQDYYNQCVNFGAIK